MAISTFHPQHHPLYPDRFVPADAPERARQRLLQWREIRASALGEHEPAPEAGEAGRTSPRDTPI